MHYKTAVEMQPTKLLTENAFQSKISGFCRKICAKIFVFKEHFKIAFSIKANFTRVFLGLISLLNRVVSIFTPVPSAFTGTEPGLNT